MRLNCFAAQDRFNNMDGKEKEKLGLVAPCLFGVINKLIPSEEEIVLKDSPRISVFLTLKEESDRPVKVRLTRDESICFHPSMYRPNSREVEYGDLSRARRP